MKQGFSGKATAVCQTDRPLALTYLNHLINRLRKKPEQYKKKQGKTLGCKSSFPSTEINKIVQTKLWSRQSEQNRNDTAHLQCQSTTKPNNPQ